MTATLRREGREATEASKGHGPDVSAYRGRILRRAASRPPQDDWV